MHPGEAWRAAVAAVRSQSIGEPLGADVRIAVHFHPDRSVDGIAVLERVADGGSYLPQFVTGISNGGLTAHPGGDRWAWESRIFHGAYDHATAEDLSTARSSNAAAPGAARSGSARAGSSCAAPCGIASRCAGPTARRRPSCPALLSAGDLLRAADAAAADPLDDDVEAHLHGGSWSRGTRCDSCSIRRCAARASRVPLRGPACPSRGMRDWCSTCGGPTWKGYRGAAPLALARDLAVDGRLDARSLGAAADELDPQLVKRAWHLIARFGEPAP